MMIEANNPDLKSWVSIEENSDFSIQNIPFGIIKYQKESPRVASRIGDYALDLLKLFQKGYLDGLGFEESDFNQARLNTLMKKGKSASRQLRNRLSELLSGKEERLKNNSADQADILIPIDQVENEMPVDIGDYTDFYSSIEHATNVGTMFRDPDNALLPNWKYIPVGYHGRASSIILSGTPIYRPTGQQKPNPDEPPVFGPCKLLDFELEMAFITYDGKPLGDRISTKEADDYIFGMVLFNDWSARDIQKFEYVPLGPFLGKSFASSISPWIVTLDALDSFRVSSEKQIPIVQDYLKYNGLKNYNINLEVILETSKGSQTKISKSNFRYMYWNMCQQLAHHTINGCNIRAGDLLASGTISGPEPHQYGSMLELSWGGTKEVKLNNGEIRKFLLNNDTIIMKAMAQSSENNIRIGFGEVKNKIIP